MLRFIFILAAFMAASLASAPSRAGSLSLIRDAEIENTIRSYATPLFRQGGIDPGAIQFHLVRERQLNAFVAEGLNMFINTGLIIRTEHPGQLIGVMAHESGHILGGHLVRGQDAYASAAAQSLAAMLLGAAAAIASGRGDVGSAVMMGGTSMAERNFLAFSRAVESSADAAALRLLDGVHWSSRGLLEFMKTLEGEELLISDRQDPYVRTHPLSSERIAEMQRHVDESPYSDAPFPPAFGEAHQRMRAKLDAFLEVPATILLRYKENDQSISARYARAIAYYRKPDMTRALPLIDKLIAERPNDPYFHELKGQMLFENGRPKEAIPEYRTAIRLLPENALLRQELGQVLIEANDPALLPEAISSLKFSVSREPDDAGSWRLLAIAYGKSNDPVMAATGMAEYALLAGRWDEAIFHSGKALQSLKAGSPTAIRMEDVRSQAEMRRARSSERKP
ncbi:peptidase M48 [Alphaproteobacteria bacterium]|nr:peptidase M48 [Alphaproteobacteria bacterium]